MLNYRLEAQITTPDFTKENKKFYFFPMTSGESITIIDIPEETIKMIHQTNASTIYYRVDSIKNAEDFINNILDLDEDLKLITTPNKLMEQVGIEYNVRAIQYAKLEGNQNDFGLTFDSIEEISETLYVQIFDKDSGETIIEIPEEQQDEEIIEQLKELFPLISNIEFKDLFEETKEKWLH